MSKGYESGRSVLLLKWKCISTRDLYIYIFGKFNMEFPRQASIFLQYSPHTSMGTRELEDHFMFSFFFGKQIIVVYSLVCSRSNNYSAHCWGISKNIRLHIVEKLLIKRLHMFYKSSYTFSFVFQISRTKSNRAACHTSEWTTGRGKKRTQSQDMLL